MLLTLCIASRRPHHPLPRRRDRDGRQERCVVALSMSCTLLPRGYVTDVEVMIAAWTDTYAWFLEGN